VYDIHVRNNSNNTRYAVIVDPGNGKVLYKQALPSSLFAAGHPGMFGKGGKGPFFGGHAGGYYDHGMMMGPPPNMGRIGPTPPGVMDS
jgi:hypothetical protein